MQFILTFSRVQETRKEKEFGKKSIIDSEEQVLKTIATIKEYENPFAFSLTRKSILKNTVTRSVVGSEHLSVSEARAIGKEHLDYFIYERFFLKKFHFGIQ